MEDQKIEAAPQAVLFAGVPTNNASSTQSSMAESDIEQQQQGSSVFGGILNSWFFENNEIDGSNTLPVSAQIPVEGVGGGVLTTKVMSALNISPAHKIEAGKMNSWAPASF